MPYVELHARSAFSFLEGASLPEALAAAAAEASMPALALLDRDGVYGAPRFHGAAKKLGIKAHIGAEVTVEENGRRWRLPLLAQSRLGYQNLCRLITRYKSRERRKGEGATSLQEVAAHAAGLVCLTSGDEGPLAAVLAKDGMEAARRQIDLLTNIFGRENIYLELQRHFDREEEARNQAAVEIAGCLRLPILATNGVAYASEIEREILDVLTCVRNHCQLETAGRLLAKNSERFLRPPAEMAQLFRDLPQAIANSEELSARLEFTLADLGYEFPRYPVPEG